MNANIVIDPAICHGKPIVKGTRTPVTVVLKALAGGDSFEAVMEDYELSLDQVLACIEFASEELARTSYFALPV